MTSKCLTVSAMVALWTLPVVKTHASIPDANGVYTGCVSNTLHSVRLIDTAVATDRCTRFEGRIVWYDAATVRQLTGTLQAQVAALQSAIAALKYVRVETGPLNGVNGPHVIFEGVNVHVRSGVASTYDATDGLGNLIVGWNEFVDVHDLPIHDRLGSNNLVAGAGHYFGGNGGFVAGSANRILAPGATVSGGWANTASGPYSHVSSGTMNFAGPVHDGPIGQLASVTGGFRNYAHGYSSVVSGGRDNIVSGSYGSICGGGFNSASGETATVSGGGGNDSTGEYSTVSGGATATASGRYSTVGGGVGNTASGEDSTVSGGLGNTASGRASTVSGGRDGSAVADYSYAP